MRYDTKIKILEKWLQSNSFTLKWSNNHSFDSANRVINISKKGTNKGIFYTLLHECGHLLQHNSVTWRSNLGDNPGSKKKLVSMYHSLFEEIDAWQRGYRLAEKLNIKVDRNDYERHAARFLCTYVHYWSDVLRKTR